MVKIIYKACRTPVFPKLGWNCSLSRKNKSPSLLHQDWTDFLHSAFPSTDVPYVINICECTFTCVYKYRHIYVSVYFKLANEKTFLAVSAFVCLKIDGRGVTCGMNATITHCMLLNTSLESADKCTKEAEWTIYIDKTYVDYFCISFFSPHIFLYSLPPLLPPSYTHTSNNWFPHAVFCKQMYLINSSPGNLPHIP